MRPTSTRVVWVLLITSLAYYASFFNYGIDLDDEGFLLANASSILDGLWPMADFFSYQPLSYFMLAGVFKIFGDSVLSERILLVTLLLANIGLIFYCATKMMALRWAWLPAAVYAFAPGPWYKIFFISHLLLSLAAALYFIQKPNAFRVFIFGITCGLAAISRIHSGEIVFILGCILLAAGAFYNADEDDATIKPPIRTLLSNGLFFIGGSILVIALMTLMYWLAGKLPSLVENARNFYNPSVITKFLASSSGRESIFSFDKLFKPHSLEMWVYAFAMLVCLFNLIRFGKELITSDRSSRYALSGLTVALFGIGSLGYTYFFVWNSRMLSSFAIVYINYFIFLAFAHQYVASHQRWMRFGRTVSIIGFGFVAIYLHSFIKVQNYSGSYTTKAEGMVQTDHPKLQGIYVYPGQDVTIARLMALPKTSGAARADFLIPMSEATTLGYLSGLTNPTYYHLFLSEFARPGEEERAIQQFEQHKVRYFVARRSQFLDGPRVGSDLSAYAPKIRAYLISNYQISELGPGFVLLERRVETNAL